MSIFRRIPNEQPPKSTLQELKEWLTRLVVHANGVFKILDDQKLDHFEPGSDIGNYGWKDLTSGIVTKGTGANNPAWTIFRGAIYAYEFQYTKSEEFWMTFHIDHDYAKGTAIFPHVHFALGNYAGAGNVQWDIDYSIAKGHQQGAPSVFAAPTTVSAVLAIDANSQYEHHVAEVSSGITDPDLEPDCLVLIRFSRNNGVGSNLAASIWGFTADIHYQTDRYATKNRSPDFYA